MKQWLTLAVYRNAHFFLNVPTNYIRDTYIHTASQKSMATFIFTITSARTAEEAGIESNTSPQISCRTTLQKVRFAEK